MANRKRSQFLLGELPCCFCDCGQAVGPKPATSLRAGQPNLEKTHLTDEHNSKDSWLSSGREVGSGAGG
eukprot:CAMPEP_0196743786 /NCGR_PEP_ID=MMETSP1091-20130531/54491_1 /TAXON_ID=302021 /ORGANISM="Rhodomonas sp., Strain CCMP768" /LENGTH=68 /DNA_ID=CAMNT_0042090219 /DNA_START=13 /DNA_END=215 /DNA_ORIENTATION=-